MVEPPPTNLADWRNLAGPVHVDLTGPCACTQFVGDSWELAITQDHASGSPRVGLFATEDLIGSDAVLMLAYHAPTGPERNAAIEFSAASTGILVHFALADVDEGEIGAITLALAGPARPKKVRWTYAPISDPVAFAEWTPLPGDSHEGHTNGTSITFIYDSRPTTSMIVFLQDFVQAWVEPDLGPDLIRSGHLIPLFSNHG